MFAGVDRYRDHALKQAFTTASREKEPYENLSLDTLRELIKRSQEEDPTAKEARRALALPQGPVVKRPGNNKVNHYRDTWEEIHGLLYRKKRLYVPPAGGACKEILQRNHNNPIAGHFTAKQTLELLARKYYWPAMESDVAQYADTCAVCAQFKSCTYKPYGKP
jgi:hypothetical protein